MEITTYKTRDLYESAAIYARHSSDFLGTEEKGRDIFFIFSINPCQETAKQYYARKLQVNAKEYADAMRTCKDIIFSSLRAGGS